MSETNPIVLVENLKSTLHRYITTTLPVSRRYPLLQKRVKELVAQQPLVKGPYIEGLPDFEKGARLKDLCEENGGCLHDKFLQLPDTILSRKLHLHQQKAFTAACKDNRSLIVATGTGSGKTECFLYPIVHHLLNDKELQKPGVRVLLIYPMNALANDQLYYRIAPLLGRYLGSEKITFGRYTSQIKANVNRADELSKIKNNSKLMDALGGSVPDNWLLTREEMLASPPHVLVTNYAMLEHLLLLPRNAPLFRENRLQTIVLDEIHTYGGAQATEVAFLLRKLKNRLDSDKPLQVFGTSASLTSGEGADKQLIDFAGTLFGEEVHEVIRGERIPHARLQEPGELFSLTPKEWASIGDILELSIEEGFSVDDWNAEFQNLGLNKKVPKLENNQDLKVALEKAFYQNSEIRRVAEFLNLSGIVPFEDVAKATFPDASLAIENKNDALNAIMHLGMTARSSSESFPLLPSRYHIATNSIEGISVHLGGNAEGWDAAEPFRTYADERKRPFYSLLVCRRCGQPYLEAFSDGERLLNLRKDGSADGRLMRKVFWLGAPAQNQVRDEDDEIIPTVDEETDLKKVVIDSSTGKILSEETGTHDAVILYEVETVTDELEKNDYVRTCKACGSRATGSMAEIITSMQAGNEALGAVVTQQVLEALPPEADREEEKPMQGRTLLSFADNRQNAAYFAPYFERTAGQLALRTAIYHVLCAENEPLNFTDLAHFILKYWKKQGDPVVYDADGKLIESQTLKREQVIGLTAAEFCTPGGRRNSLEALGLVRITLESRKLSKLIKEVEKIIPEPLQSYVGPLVSILLETIRREKAITNLADVDMRDPHLWSEPYSNHRSFELYKINPKVTNGWIPPEGRNYHNRRTWYLIERLGMTWSDARDFLGKVWAILCDQKILISMQPGFGIDSNLLRLESGESQLLSYCQDCGLLQAAFVDNHCTAFRCKGLVRPLSLEEHTRLHAENHYIHSIKKGGANTVRAREHTASLSTDVRERIEQEFSERKINLLSCTTTMEMGVDLGDLEAIICLNIPPGISNYQQRTGRAGRRAQAAPFCVTIARNSQYDQAVFRDFIEYLEQAPPVPRVFLDNAKLFNRHQNSIVLSGFLRDRIKDLSTNAPSLADFFGKEFQETDYKTFMESVNHWLEGDEGMNHIEEAEKLGARLPSGLGEKIALHDVGLRHKFLEQMNVFAQTVRERWAIYEVKKGEYIDAKEFARAGHWETLQKKYMNQFLVNQLSLQGMIPTYSFPVNSLSLDVTREYNQGGNFPGQSDISLTRDAMLGISEYAPGAEVIANGRVWTSAGLAYYPRDFMPTRYYVACKECHHVEIREDMKDMGGSCAFCGNESLGLSRAFIEPRGFVTSYNERKGKDPSQHRVRKQYADEAKLISIARNDQYAQTDHPSISKALLRSHAADPDKPVGKLFIVNRGRYRNGFHQCGLCNYMEPALKREQKTVPHSELLGSKKCYNTKLSFPVDIAHVFNTDVCIFRFNTQLPPPPQNVIHSKKEYQRYFDSFSRTLNEALRFAAAKVTGLQADVIRSAHKFGQGYLSSILYDSVPGGAGYAVRIFNEIPVTQLLEAAIHRLDCPNHCSTACRSCLCDYSNQMSWDLFDRKPVLTWLKKLMFETVEHPITKQGGMLWEHPSLALLREELLHTQEIHLLGHSLISNETTVKSDVLKWLSGLLIDDYRVYIHLQHTIPSGKKLSHQGRMILNQLRPFIEQGRLYISIIKGQYELAKLPRVCASPLQGGFKCFTDYPVPAILDQLLPQPVYKLHGEFTGLPAFVEYVQTAQQLTVEELYPAENKMQRWQLASGQQRNFGDIFSSIRGVYVEKLIIKDPYCSVANSINSLCDFLEIIQGTVSTLSEVQIHFQELNFNDPNYQSIDLARKGVQLLVHKKIAITPKVTVIPYKNAKNFHDRVVYVDCIDSEGKAVQHIYDLSGGVDKLMDQAVSTLVFYSRYEK
jgi:ATP-dependent helicase YprA (DUF1998 family)